MTTPIFRDRIDSKMAWRAEDIRSKDDFAFDLSRPHIVALEEILQRIAKLPLQDIRAEQCRHPAIDDDFSKIMDDVQFGRGFVVMRGLPVFDHPLDEIERMYWAIALHWGTPLSQSVSGEVMGYVREERLPGAVQEASDTKTSGELGVHTDNGEILTVLCVRQAKEGGSTLYASALAIHNEILATHPEALPILYRGFRYHRKGRQQDNQALITPHNVPVFSNVDGMVSVQFVLPSIMSAFHALGQQPTDEELGALSIFEDCAKRLQVDCGFAPGEMSVVNDLTMVRSRTQYIDWNEPEKRRLLLRLWLEAARNRRPVAPEIFIYDNVGGRFGIDPVPGRKVAAAEGIGEDYLPALDYNSLQRTERT